MTCWRGNHNSSVFVLCFSVYSGENDDDRATDLTEPSFSPSIHLVFCLLSAVPCTGVSFSVGRLSIPVHSLSAVDEMVWRRGSRSWFSNEAMAIDSNAAGGFIDVPLGAGTNWGSHFLLFGREILWKSFRHSVKFRAIKQFIEITSRFKGKVALISHAPGDIIKVGETLVKLAVEDAQDALLVSSDSSKSKTDNLVGALSTPSVRNLAKDLGIDINAVTGSGKDGRVLKEDVLRFGGQKGNITDSVTRGDSVSTTARDSTELWSRQ
ncbi:hypothetical protein HID58_096003 [Brassica napus]|uniref:Peripheral subunit-binding (PSBD) domain-containing protein n=1 Tax=Brassica napus TaxID=3708 RepID=A0ABQ7X397_BRANA|nr:hypothetical protein HID58_096003 [Brassica napus]